MSSKCEKNFPVCASDADIDVNVTNFAPTTCPDNYPGLAGNTPEENGILDPYVKAKILTKVADAKITQPITDSILISDTFYSIKRISRRVVLTQCYVVPEEIGYGPSKDGYYNHCNAHLFVEGFILKNVEYATPSAGQTPPGPCDECIAMRNDYRDLTAKIKFSFSVPIDLDNANIAYPVKDNERAILKDCMKPCDRGSISESDCERIHCQSVELQEPFTCELDKYEICEAVISKTSCRDTNANLFDTLVEKLTLKLNISIFQLQTKKVQIKY
ncbi:MAG: hypothetical protein ACRCVJ_06690 [Clostridium sp.]|uniref:DUF7852 domain-containing protein n=1 Tax=Clostridium sp. TaxID=1506 RepID=UPI003F3BCB96